MIIYDLGIAVAGAFIGAFIALLHEHSKKPDVDIVIGNNADGTYANTGKVRFLHIKVINKERRCWLSQFIKGYVIMGSCKAKIEFLNPTTKIVIFPFQGRWSSTPEPYIPINQGVNQGVFDPSKAIAGEIENIFPGESRDIDVALKLEGKKEFVGFNNWSYLYNNWWNNNMEILTDTIYVRITLSWTSGKKSKTFVISNPHSSLENFQIREIQD